MALRGFSPTLIIVFLVFPLFITEAGRSMEITFEKSFPFEIVSWGETSMSGSGKNAGRLTTMAVRNKTLVSDYWNRNRAVDKAFRKELGI